VWLGLGAGVVAGAIIADEAYQPHPGHYYDEGPYDGPYYYPANYRGDPREICAQNFRSIGAPASTRPTQVRGGSVPT